MNTVLEASDLCKTYSVDKRQNNVLKNINFSVKEGEMVAIMGPSGSGKSTLLYTVSGMDDATGGDVFFEDKNIAKLDGNELAALRLDEMGFIFQQMYMMKNLTILDNIVLPAMQSKKTKETKKEKVQRGETLMRKLGIIEIADNDINEVSGGQLQRACICRSMINKPRLLFADEPTGALNRTSSDEVMEGMTDCLVKGDKERVIEVLQNIMENAIKYGDGRQITIAFSEEEDCRLVSVVNTGSSIPEAELVHIFDSFYRGSNADHVKGSGLGLYICRSLMHRMDGEVFAEQSEDGFLVTVVIRKAG